MTYEIYKEENDICTIGIQPDRTDISSSKEDTRVNNYRTEETMIVEDDPSYTLQYTYVTCSVVVYDVESMNIAWQQKITNNNGHGFDIDIIYNSMFVNRIAFSIFDGMVQDRAI